MFKEYLESYNIEKRITHAYNPKCNGILERYNKILKDLLIKDFTQNKNNYDIRISLEKWLYSYNYKKHNVINFIPSNLFESKNKEDWKKAIENNLINKKK